jgi:hypothetical protein
MTGMPSAARSRIAVVIAFAAGVLVTAWFLRTGAPLAFVNPAADVRISDAKGRSVALGRDGALRAGQRLRAGARAVHVDLARGGSLDLAPHSRLLIADPSPEIEAGLVVVDTTTVTREVRIETPSGSLVLSSARVDVRAGVVLPEPGGGATVAYLHVEEGSVTLASRGQTLFLGRDEGGVLITGRPPMRRPPTPVAVEAAPSQAVEAFEDDLQSPPEEPLAVPVAVPVPVVIPVVAGGSIGGVVDLEGTPPPDETRAAACGPAGSPAWAVSGGHLANVFVHLTGNLPAAPVLAPVEVALRGCAFAPRVVGVQLGQRVGFAADGGHQVRVVAGLETLFETHLWPDRVAPPWTASREGTFTLRTDDPQATGVLAVSPHPYFAVSGSDGRFTINGVPPGHYTVSAWHELGGTRTAEVTVTLARPAEVHLQYALQAPVAVAAAAIIEAPAPVAVEEPVAVAAPAVAHRMVRECQLAVGTGSVIAQACTQGGLDGAGVLMKQIVGAARERGFHLRCSSCHSDQTTFALLPTARDQLQRLLFTPVVSVAFIPPRAVVPAAKTQVQQRPGAARGR